ncbi:MAG TPA: hypothetical protein ENK11_07400 [Phycisphaerales bacterium]|nr:hypothetical protein [Phycisphaerales bacterium]
MDEHLSQLSFATGTALHVGGDLTHTATNEDDHATRNGTICMDGTGVQHFEVAGADLGLPIDDIANNFNWGAMVVGQSTQTTNVILQDVIDNGNRGPNDTPEVLYLSGFPQGDNGLSIRGGSVLNLNGLDAYVGTVNGWVHLNELFSPGQLRIPYDDGFIQLTVCPADLNDDGVIDLNDINIFSNGFLSSDPVADLNGDGLLDLDDIAFFISAFNAGCM